MRWLSKEKKDRIKKWTIRLVKYGILGIIGFAVLSYLAAEYTSRPQFCISCHIMKPYFVSWQESHHKNVACVECHIPPGVTHEIRAKYQALGMVAKYFTQTYGSKPWAEIPDSACLREGCHQTRLLNGKVTAQLGDVKIVFDHTPHLTETRRGMKLRCTSCHSQIVQGEHITVTPSSCVLCHFKGLQQNQSVASCLGCHSGLDKVVEFQGVRVDHKEIIKQGISCERCHVDVVVGDGAVPKQRCYTCHDEAWKLDKYNDINLIHSNHVTKHSIDCLHCHVEIQHKINKMSPSVAIDCQTCHPDHHVAQKEMYMGIGGKGTHPQKMDPMFLAQVSCSGCHSKPHGDEITNATMTAGKESCVSCHNDQYQAILSGWQNRLQLLVTELTDSLTRAKTEIKGNAQAKALLAEAEYNLRFVQYGKGVHNIQYAQELLESSQSQIEQALKLVKSKYQPKFSLIKHTGANADCYTCHFGIENNSGDFGGLIFPHGIHLEKAQMNCLKCHQNTPQKHGVILVQKSDCETCHHAQKDAQCSACHSFEANMYTGDMTVVNIKATPNIMAKKVPCEGCHQDLSKGSDKKKIKDTCAACHDKTYPDMVDGWEENTLDGLKDVDKLYGPVAKHKWTTPEQQQLFKETQLIIDVLKRDKSNGAHNMEFSDNLITEAKKRLVQLNKDLPVIAKTN